MNIIIIISLIIFTIFILTVIVSFYNTNIENNRIILLQNKDIISQENSINNIKNIIKTESIINQRNLRNIGIQMQLDSNNISETMNKTFNSVNCNIDIQKSNIISQTDDIKNLKNYTYSLSNSFIGDEINGNKFIIKNTPYYLSSNSKLNNIYLNSVNLSNNSFYSSNNKLSLDISDSMEFKTGSGLKASFIHDSFGSTSLYGDLYSSKDIKLVGSSNKTALYTNNSLNYIKDTDIASIYTDESNNLNISSLNKSININNALYTSNNDIIFSGLLYTNDIILKEPNKLCIGSNCISSRNNGLYSSNFNSESLCINNMCLNNLNNTLYTSSPITLSNNINISGNFCINNVCLNSSDILKIKSNNNI